jgi:cell cycle sensor histidine kinase DivJ
MRSGLGLSKERLASGEGHRVGRPDALRRTTLAINARMLIAAAALCMPLALFELLHGAILPVIIASLSLAIGGATLLWSLHGATEKAAAGQVYGILVVGSILTTADPMIADFGLAVCLLAPILAALIGRGRERRWSWILLGITVALGFAGGLLHVSWPQPIEGGFELVGVLAFSVIALVVAHTSNRMNTAFEVYDRGQINAYRHLIEHMQDGVLRFSSEGDLLFSSGSTEKLLGCPRYELSGPGLFERIHVLDRPVYMTAFAEANRGLGSRKVDVRMRYDRTPGTAPSYIWIEVGLSPVSGQNDETGRYEVMALLRDITDRRDRENEMRAARRTAEEASDAKTRFLATIGHELRTPLNAIVGFSEMMTAGIGGEPSPTHREYATLIHNSGTHLIGVVGMLLDMSRIEAGKFEVHTDSFQPDSLVAPCLSMVGQLAQARKVRFETRLSAVLPLIVADERACRQILINLVSNAVKFSHEGGVVTVGMKRQGGWLNMSVTDHGIGMAPDAVARVGEAFFQVHEGLSRRYEGTGLGLSIVKGLVDLHEGELRVTSEAGVGTTMTVLLPINGPETKMPETGSVTPLRRDEAAPTTVAQWPEQKRSAK